MFALDENETEFVCLRCIREAVDEACEKVDAATKLRKDAEAALEAMYSWGLADIDGAVFPLTFRPCYDVASIAFGDDQHDGQGFFEVTHQQFEQLLDCDTHEQRVQFVVGIMAAQEDASD